MAELERCVHQTTVEGSFEDLGPELARETALFLVHQSI